MVNVIMHGCNGHMGRVVTELIEKDENVQIVAGIDAYTGFQNEYPVFPSIKECTVKADVIIEQVHLLFFVQRDLVQNSLKKLIRQAKR